MSSLRALVLATALSALPLPAGAAPDAADVAQAAPFETQVREQTDATLGGMVRDGRSSYAAAVFVDGGRLAFASTYGVEAPGSTLPFSIESTHVDLNSINKLFTAIAIAQLIDRGAIASIDDPVNRYLKHYQLPPAFGREVTIRAVATHSAGFDEAAFGAGPLLADPAQFFARRFPGYYENTGLFSAYDSYGPKLLAFMVSEVAGTPWPRYVEESILAPLGMHSTYLRAPPVPVAHRVVAFQTRLPANTAEIPPLRTESEALLGGVSVSTLADMAKLVAALVGPADDRQVITQSMRDVMFQVLQSNGEHGAAHGLLFDALRTPTKTLFVHGGIGPGTDCMMALDPARSAGIFYCYGDVRLRFGNNPAFSPPVFEQVTGAMLKPFTACPGTPGASCVRYPPPRWNPAWSEYLGDYVDYARHHHGFSRIRTLLHPTVVRVERAPNSLRLDGHDGYVEIAPGTFGSRAYTETFTFIRDPATDKIVLSMPDRPSVYERPGLLENPKFLPRLLAALVLVAISGGLLVLWPTYGMDDRVRLAVAAYCAAIGAGVVVMFGLRAFGQRYFEGIAWPLHVVRVCAFLTIPACALLIAMTYGAHRRPRTGIARLGRLHLDILCVSSILMVWCLFTVELLSFGPIT